MHERKRNLTNSLSDERKRKRTGKSGRVWCDGCYDMVHFGHANQLRQAKEFGHYLVVGVHTDAEIRLHKGPPVFTEEERYRMVKGIKWVDEVIKGAPYVTSVETLDKYDCDFCVHGDDITLTDQGVDTYEEVKRCGRYKECSRTAGVSTTDLVNRMLVLRKNHQCHFADGKSNFVYRERAQPLSTGSEALSPWTCVSHSLSSTQILMQFSDRQSPRIGDVVVYVCGAFDLFHIGHLSFLEEARKLGDYLIVGIHNDQVVNSYKGGNHPVMSLQERVLSVLAYKPVSDVVIDAPFVVTADFIHRFNIQIVAHGLRTADQEYLDMPDPFKVSKNMDIFRLVDSGNNMTTDLVIDRILERRLLFEQRNRNKEKKEVAAYKAMKVRDNFSTEVPVVISIEDVKR